jgi:uncharacterized protein (TIGR02001 family)
MLTSVRSLLAASALAGAFFVATPAMAQDEEESSPITISGSAAIVSDYRFRGVSLSNGDPAVQAGITVSHESGFYIATWGSSIYAGDQTITLDDGTGDPVSYTNGSYGSLELDVYGGWTGEVTDGVTVDVGFLYYLYPDAVNTDAQLGALGASGLPEFDGYADFDTDYYELYGSVGFGFGPAKIKLGAAYAPDQDSLASQDNLYLYSNLDVGIPDFPITFSAHLGYADGVQAPSFLAGSADDSAFDYSIGAAWNVYGPLTLGVSYIDTEGPSVNNFTDDAIVGSLTAAF